MFNDYSLNMNIEFIDICYGLKNGLKQKGNFYLVDNTIPTDDKFITFLKSSLKSFGYQVDNVLGKGNYGVVFAAKSEHYGNVAIKIAANKDGAFYDMENKQECCYYPTHVCQKCSKTVNKLLPFEVANAVLTNDADGVVKNKAFGIISSHTKLLFYIIVMEKIENSMTLLSFTQNCFKKFNNEIRLKFIKNSQLRLNEINKNLIKNFNIFHNDLKSDNILVKVKDATKFKKCGSGREDLEYYLIDFGNAILNVNQKDQAGNSILLFDQFKYKKYFIIYRAPDVGCQLQYAKMPQLISWYLGIIAFEMCSNGLEHINLSADANVCYAIQNRNAQNSNSFDQIIRHNPKTRSLKLCNQNDMAQYLQTSLIYDPNVRPSSDNLMKLSLINKEYSG
ncbi:unnamed protein product [Brachionus calyciflorus]|uniref:Protein kinase domain-containing protein n=1 Tax=Brachionus calyciflorus TaxID=104777 RepID=A0A814C875_9BILA|nr:unnamed protein product [Brachionus calyciflorus]